MDAEEAEAVKERVDMDVAGRGGWCAREDAGREREDAWEAGREGAAEDVTLRYLRVVESRLAVNL